METYTDDDGTWEVHNGAYVLVTPSQAWLDERQAEHDAEAAAPGPPEEAERQAVRENVRNWNTLTAADRMDTLRRGIKLMIGDDS